MATLLAWAETQRMGISNCPLCSSIAPEDSPELINHILKHVYEFSLRALPWPAPAPQNLSQLVGTFALPDNGDKNQMLENWVISTDMGPSSALQISSFDNNVAREGDVIPDDLDFSGYVPMDEFFDETSSNNSSKLQVGLTEVGQISEVGVQEDRGLDDFSVGGSSHKGPESHLDWLPQHPIYQRGEAMAMSQTISRIMVPFEHERAHEEGVNEQENEFSQLLPLDEIAGSRPISIEFRDVPNYRYSIGRDAHCGE